MKKIETRSGRVAYGKIMQAWNIFRLHCFKMRAASGLPKYMFWHQSLILTVFKCQCKRSIEKVIPCQRFSDTMYSS